MDSIEPALPMDKMEPALPMLRTLPTLKRLKRLNELLALSGLAKFPVLMGTPLRLRLERVYLPMIDSCVLYTSLTTNPSVETV